METVVITEYSKEQLSKMSLDQLVSVRAQWLCQLESLLENLAASILYSDNMPIIHGRRETNVEYGGLKMRATEIDSTYVVQENGNGFATTWWVSVLSSGQQVAEYRVLDFPGQPITLQETKNTFARPSEPWISMATRFIDTVEKRRKEINLSIEDKERNRLLRMLAG